MNALRVLILAFASLLLPSSAAAVDPRLPNPGGAPASAVGDRPAPQPPASAGPVLKNVKLLAHADPGGGFNADVFVRRGFAYLPSWGTPSPEGFPEGVFCPSRGVRVYDVRDRRNPVAVATFADAASDPALAGTWTEKIIVTRVKTRSFRGDLAAVSVQNCVEDAFRGFALYDVSDPTDPQRLALYETPNTGGSHEIWLKRVGRKAYVYTAIILSELTTSPDFDPEQFTASTPGEPDFRIIDVSDPRNPVKVGEWGAWAELGVHPLAGQGAVPENFVHSVITNRAGTKAFLSYWDLGTVILDISNPTEPSFLGRTEFAPHEEGNAHSAWLGKHEDLLIQTDEDFDPAPSDGIEQSWGYPRFFDISDPANPVQLSTFKLPSTTALPPPGPGDFTVHDPKVRGNLAYLSWYSEGVVVLDISEPEEPEFVAQFVPPPTPDPTGFGDLLFGTPEDPHPAYPEVWGVFPVGRTIFASDMNSGLWIFKLKKEDHHQNDDD
jgi:hypothetical protein